MYINIDVGATKYALGMTPVIFSRPYDAGSRRFLWNGAVSSYFEVTYVDLHHRANVGSPRTEISSRHDVLLKPEAQLRKICAVASSFGKEDLHRPEEREIVLRGASHVAANRDNGHFEGARASGDRLADAP